MKCRILIMIPASPNASSYYNAIHWRLTLIVTVFFSIMPYGLCEARREESPEDFIKTYYSLINENKFDEAYGFNSRYLCSKVSLEDFKKEWGNNKSISLEKVDIITRSDVEALVLVRFISEDTDLGSGIDTTTPYRAPIRLVFEKGSWHYDGGIFRTDSPRRQLEFVEIRGIPESPVRPFTSMDMEITFKNNGKSGVRGGITVSFPDSPMVTISPSQKEVKLYAPGDIISTNTREKIKSSDLVLEYWAENPWKSGDTRTLKFQVTPRPEGRCRIRYRAMVRDGEDAEYPCPQNSEVEDQQGFACFEKVIQVSYIGTRPAGTTSGISPEWRYPQSVLSLVEELRQHPGSTPPELEYRHQRLNSPEGRMCFVDVNPRGDRLAAEIEETGGLHRLFVLNLISGEWTPWSNNTSLEAFKPLWSTDGKSLAFYMNGASGDELWTLAWEGARSIPRKAPSSNKKANRFFDRYPAWSPDGMSLAYSNYGTEKPRINIRNLKDGADRAMGSGTGDEVGPRWSPDGKWIAFFAQEKGRSSIFKKSLDNELKKELTPGDIDAILPQWLSQSHIAFLGRKGDNHYGLWLTDAGGKSLIELVTEADEDFSHFAFSGDGRLLIVIRGGRLYQYALKSWSFPPKPVQRSREASKNNNWIWLLAGGFLLLMGSAALNLQSHLWKKRRAIAPSTQDQLLPSQPTAPVATSIRNPYVAGNPITERSLFFGREDIFNFIREKITGANSSSALVLYGNRRTGKTSVLCQIMNGRLGESFVPVYNDMQEMADIDTHEFFEHLQKNIRGCLFRAFGAQFTATFSPQDFSKKEKNPYQLFDSLLDYIERGLEEKIPRHNLLVLIDEYEILGSKVEKGHLSDEVFQYLRAIMQNRIQISFIFTGTRQLELLKGSHWSLMFNSAIYRKISFLEPEDARELIVSPLRGQANYEREAVDAILRLTAGHPYFIQLICLNTVDLMNQRHISRITVETVRSAVESISLHPVPHLIYLWKECSKEERIIMAALSDHLTDSTAWATVAALENTLRDENITLAPDVVRNALNGCIQNEFLERGKEGDCRFLIDLLRFWIKTEHPLWKVIEDEAG